jgi:hypothetical protein
MTKFAKAPAEGDNAKTRLALRRGGRTLLRSAVIALALGALATPASARPFQQYLNGNCAGTLCTINFAKVPAASRLDVDNVSCYMRLKLGTGGTSVQIRAAQVLVVGANPNNVLNAVTLVPELTGRTLTEDVFAANHAISAFAGAGGRLQAYLELERGSFSQFACHISGELVKL